MGRFDGFLIKAGCFFINIYRLVLKPLFPLSCRFYPSCSEYAVHAIKGHGLSKGVLLALGRLCRCHPFACGGIDTVPLKKDGKL